MALFAGEGVVPAVLEDEVAGDEAGGEAGAGADEQADLVEGVAAIEEVGDFFDCAGVVSVQSWFIVGKSGGIMLIGGCEIYSFGAPMCYCRLS